MEETSFLWAQQHFSCSICLDLLKDPVTIPCGHNYCMRCIACYWDQDEQRRSYRCPQCRMTFSQRPALSKNVVFAEMVNKLKKITGKADGSAYCDAGDVEFDVCTKSEQKAIHFCLDHLREMQKKCKQRIQQREQERQKLKDTVKSHKRSAQAAVEDSERIFTEIISSIERSRSEMTQLIRDQENEAVSRAEGVLEQLNQEIDDLKRKNTELEQLSHTQDHIYLMQNCKSISDSGTRRINVSSFDDVGKSIDKLRDKLQNFCEAEMGAIFSKVKNIQIVPGAVNDKREDYLKYFRQFTLDLNTVNKNLRLSEGNRVITDTETTHQYPEHPDRFHGWKQVLCKESVSDHCYWEVELTGNYGVSISLAYKNICRKGMGDECRFGYNDQSWRLFCSRSRFSFCHNKKEINLPVLSSCSKIGVYVDHSAGTMSFFSVSDTMTLIHSVQTTFTKPLYLGLGLSMHSTVKLCPLTNGRVQRYW